MGTLENSLSKKLSCLSRRNNISERQKMPCTFLLSLITEYRRQLMFALSCFTIKTISLNLVLTSMSFFYFECAKICSDAKTIIVEKV